MNAPGLAVAIRRMLEGDPDLDVTGTPDIATLIVVRDLAEGGVFRVEVDQVSERVAGVLNGGESG